MIRFFSSKTLLSTLTSLLKSGFRKDAKSPDLGPVQKLCGILLRDILKDHKQLNIVEEL